MRCLGHALLPACALLVALFTDPASAERRVAFVVGNGAYQHTSTLPNPPVDARAMSALLRNVGFDVVEGTDLGRDAMTGLLRDFAAKTEGADVALFFYAGHGIAVDGKNYLIPVDADLKSEIDVKFGAAIDVEVTLDQTMADAKIKLVFLDACRDNPFANKIRSAARTRSVAVSSGLVEMKSGEGTLVAFATGPGQTALDGRQGQNSPFTRALLSNVAQPGVEIRQALTMVRAQVSTETSKQQLPWENTNLTGFFYMNPAAAAAPAATASLPPPVNAAPSAAASNDIELEFWRSVRNSDKAEELSAYLARFPNGNFVSLARARIAALQTGSVTRSTDEAQSIRTAAATQETEDQLALDPRKRADIQRRLAALGYFQGGQDGAFRDNTRRAIEHWQAARAYPKSGYLNKLQQDALLAERLPRPAAPPVARPAPPVQARGPAPGPGPQDAPIPAHPGGSNVDPAGAAFMGGVIGGALGGLRR
jgi:uncharacterized caspase-like protein